MTAVESRLPAALLAAGLAGALASAALVPYPLVADGPMWCPFRALTGVECPTCGMTRSWSLLAHGDVPAANAMHPVGPFVLALAVVTLLAMAWRWTSGRWPVAPAHLTRTLVVLSVATGAFGVARWVGLAG